MRYAIKVCYDGTDYGGWQVQNNAPTVQEEMEKAALAAFGQRVKITASGRTDAGVHAAGQVCHFEAELTVPPEKIADALNAHLPADIAVLTSVAAPDGFDANRAAKRKTYCYRLYISPRRNPLKDRYAAWVKGRLNGALLEKCGRLFEGEHDFRAYMASRSQVKTTVRTVYSVVCKSGFSRGSDDVEIYVCGNGFLYNMVRTMAGTMVGFSQGKITEEQVKATLERGERRLVGKTMPPNGLTLESVEYAAPIF